MEERASWSKPDRAGWDSLTGRRKIRYVQRPRAVRRCARRAVGWRRPRERSRARCRSSNAILATGSSPVTLPGFPDRFGARPRFDHGTRVRRKSPGSLLVVGGGYIGSRTGVGLLGAGQQGHRRRDAFGPRCSPAWTRISSDRSRRAHRAKTCEAVLLDTRVAAVKEQTQRASSVTLEGRNDRQTVDRLFDRVLVSVGRRPNSPRTSGSRTPVVVKVDDHGLRRQVDERLRTSGADNPRHRRSWWASRCWRTKRRTRVATAVEDIAGPQGGLRALPPSPPSCSPTPRSPGAVSPRTEARRQQGRKVEVARFPVGGIRPGSLTLGRDDGLTKLIHRSRDPSACWVWVMVGPGRRRADRRGRAGNRDGRHRHRPQAQHPPAPDAVGDADGGRGGLLRPEHARPPAASRLIRGTGRRPGFSRRM